MSACLVFVFAALLEYAVVNVIARKQELKKLIKSHERVSQVMTDTCRCFEILNEILLHLFKASKRITKTPFNA